MTVLNLKEIFESFDVFEWSYTFEPGEIKLPAELGEIKEPLKVFIKITKDRKGYEVYLSMVGSVELECSRCLSPFTKDLSQERRKHVEIYPKEDSPSLSPEDLEVSFMEEPDVIDLEEIIREEVILSVPMKPLCRPDCPGIHHSSLLFEEEKGHTGDPRFAILKNLLSG